MFDQQSKHLFLTSGLRIVHTTYHSLQDDRKIKI